MKRYAEGTEVPVDRSKAEIERILARYGADQFMYGSSQEKAMIAFRACDRFVRFVLPLPEPEDGNINRTPKGRVRKGEAARREHAQEIRRRWRALTLSIKSKLEAVQTGITTFEQEFLAHIVLPDKRTVGEFMIPQIKEAYQQERMPKLLPFLQ